MGVDYIRELKNIKYYNYVLKKLKKYVSCGKCPESLWYEGEYIRHEIEGQDDMKDMSELLEQILLGLEVVPVIEARNRYNRYKSTCNKGVVVKKLGVKFTDSAVLQLFKDLSFAGIVFLFLCLVPRSITSLPLYSLIHAIFECICWILIWYKLLLLLLRVTYLYLHVFKKVSAKENICSPYLVGYDFADKCNKTSMLDVLLKDIHSRNMVWLNSMLEDSNKALRASYIQIRLENAKNIKEEIKALVEIELLYNE